MQSGKRIAFAKCQKDNNPFCLRPQKDGRAHSPISRQRNV